MQVIARVRSQLTVWARPDARGCVRAGMSMPGRLRVVLPAVGEGAHGVDEIAHRGEGAPADGLLGDDAQGDLDELEPRIWLTWCCGKAGRPWPVQRRSTLG